jgi:hypothetical protein
MSVRVDSLGELARGMEPSLTLLADTILSDF